MREQTPKEIAESIMRSHDEFCIGHVKEDEPWCSTVDAPFCPACQKLADAIEAALSARCTALEQENQQLRAAQQADQDRFDRDLENYSQGYTEAVTDVTGELK